MKEMTGMITTYADNICELEKANNIFAPIDNADANVRKKIQTEFTKASQALCDQRKSDNIVGALKLEINGEKDAHHKKQLKNENAKENKDANARQFNEKMAIFSEEQRAKFIIRKSRQVDTT
jgi:hypothetical protein